MCSEAQWEQLLIADTFASGIRNCASSGGSSSTQLPFAAWSATRRDALASGAVVAAAACAARLTRPPPAEASRLGGAVDGAWEALGGGPPDLFFPPAWAGTWDVVSTLVKVEAPLGEDKVPNQAAFRRTLGADLNKPIGYQVAFMRDREGRAIFDRRFNMASMLAQYYPGSAAADLGGRITWDPLDPNVLQLHMPGGLDVRTRITRRSQQETAPGSRFETSEYVEQVLDSGGATRVKASQCFTKYLYRDEAAAAESGGPAVVATQVVSDYLTPFDGEAAYLAARSSPVAVYTYKLSFSRRSAACSGGACSDLGTS